MLKQSRISLRKHPTHKKVKDHSPTQPWFDDECKNIKKHLQKLAKLITPAIFRHTHWTPSKTKRTQNIWVGGKNEISTRSKCEPWVTTKTNRNGLGRVSKNYAGPEKNSGAPNIDVESWKTHFKNTLQTDRQICTQSQRITLNRTLWCRDLRRWDCVHS